MGKVNDGKREKLMHPSHDLVSASTKNNLLALVDSPPSLFGVP